MSESLFSKIHIRIIARVLLVNVIVLGILHFISVAIELYAPNNGLVSYTKLFDLDREYNVPTFYSSLLLLTMGLTAGYLGLKVKHFYHKAFWIGFSLFFTYWAVDEALVLHERLAGPIREMLQIGYDSVFYHAWVLVAIGLIGLLGVVVLLFFHFRMPALTKDQGNLLLTLLIFMSGIVLLEILGTKLYGNPHLYRLGIVPLEELFEIGMGSFLLFKLVQYKTVELP